MLRSQLWEIMLAPQWIRVCVPPQIAIPTTLLLTLLPPEQPLMCLSRRRPPPRGSTPQITCIRPWQSRAGGFLLALIRLLRVRIGVADRKYIY